jgi:hypothetical protein
MSPTHLASAALSAPLNDCCRVRAERSTATPARLLEPLPIAIALLVVTPRIADDLRPEPRFAPRLGPPHRSGPPLYTLFAVLLI